MLVASSRTSERSWKLLKSGAIIGSLDGHRIVGSDSIATKGSFMDNSDCCNSILATELLGSFVRLELLGSHFNSFDNFVGYIGFSIKGDLKNYHSFKYFFGNIIINLINFA